MKNKTKMAGGKVSPKAPSAAVAALLAPLVARLLSKLFGFEIENEVAEGVVLAAIAGLGALAGAFLAPPGEVVIEAPVPPAPPVR
jgi:uncharacterized protein (DUF697 family)